MNFAKFLRTPILHQTSGRLLLEIRVTTKEELNDLEKVSLTVNLIQKHVNSLMESNIALQKKCSELELSIDNHEQYSRRTCLRITDIPCEEKETSEEVLEKVKKLMKKQRLTFLQKSLTKFIVSV